MRIAGLIEIALSDVDDHRVDVVALEPAEISSVAVGGLTELVFELVNNAITFSGPGEKVRVAGLFDQDSYLISISDSGVGISDHLMEALNGVLEGLSATGADAGSMLGILVVARLAARHGISVRLVPAVPGTTARVTIPAKLVRRLDGEQEESASKATPTERLTPGVELPDPFGESPPVDEPDEELVVTYDPRTGAGQVDSALEPASRTRQAYLETEAFLERIFAPLWDEPPVSDLAGTDAIPDADDGEAEHGQVEAPVEEAQDTGVLQLQVRVPGGNFVLTEDDPSTAAGEAAVDIRSALSRFDQGRRSAEQADEYY